MEQVAPEPSRSPYPSLQRHGSHHSSSSGRVTPSKGSARASKSERAEALDFTDLTQLSPLPGSPCPPKPRAFVAAPDPESSAPLENPASRRPSEGAASPSEREGASKSPRLSAGQNTTPLTRMPHASSCNCVKSPTASSSSGRRDPATRARSMPGSLVGADDQAGGSVVEGGQLALSLDKDFRLLFERADVALHRIEQCTSRANVCVPAHEELQEQAQQVDDMLRTLRPLLVASTGKTVVSLKQLTQQLEGAADTSETYARLPSRLGSLCGKRSFDAAKANAALRNSSRTLKMYATSLLLEHGYRAADLKSFATAALLTKQRSSSGAMASRAAVLGDATERSSTSGHANASGAQLAKPPVRTLTEDLHPSESTNPSEGRSGRVTAQVDFKSAFENSTRSQLTGVDNDMGLLLASS
mmetsp:Transcript_6125/g.10152  ORF Transcript_6125/g.10152 Transcript_6125/m.10152 type:complete len:415 (+) Transcript_6125:108-1352(+)